MTHQLWDGIHAVMGCCEAVAVQMKLIAVHAYTPILVPVSLSLSPSFSYTLFCQFVLCIQFNELALTMAT